MSIFYLSMVDFCNGCMKAYLRSVYNCLRANSQRFYNRTNSVFSVSQETIVDPTGAAALFEEARTPPKLKKLVTYEDAKHGLFGEPPRERAAIEREILDWVAKFVPSKD